MKKSRFIIKCLAIVFRWVFYLNIVLAGGAIGFQAINLLITKKIVTVPYLGKFSFQLNRTGDIRMNHSDPDRIPMIMKKITGYPSIVIPGKTHLVLTLIYTLFLSIVVLFSNYYLKNIFFELNKSVQTGQPFHKNIPRQMRTMAYGFLVFFIIGIILTTCKLIFIKAIVIIPDIYLPAFDNTVLNYLWIGIFIYIMAEVFQAGLLLKEENDLTI